MIMNFEEMLPDMFCANVHLDDVWQHKLKSLFIIIIKFHEKLKLCFFLQANRQVMFQRVHCSFQSLKIFLKKNNEKTKN